MNLHLDHTRATDFKSRSQIARRVTEEWVRDNMFCPVCGHASLTKYENNRPVADFFCETCGSDFELKSKNICQGGIGWKIPDGAYKTMMSRIHELHNPNLLVMAHSESDVKDLILVPSHFFVPSIIEERKPLAPSARRAGWIGCNILYDKIPERGKIYIVKDYKEIDESTVLNNYKRTTMLNVSNIEGRGWIMDVLSCLDRLSGDEFDLDQVYAFADELRQKHPGNKHVRDKIRQQLQYLRDKGFIEFKPRGHYRKIRPV